MATQGGTALGDATVPRRPSPPSWLSSTTVNTLVGILGTTVALLPFLPRGEPLRDALLYVAGAIIVGMALRAQWLRRTQVAWRRGDAKSMDDGDFYRRVEANVLSRALNQLEDLADGHLRVFAAEVPYISLLLFRVLGESASGDNKRVRATDLTRDPKLLLSRSDYLDANRRLAELGGTVQRIFICKESSLLKKSFAQDLLELIKRHKDARVECGLAVWEQVRPEAAVDFVVFAAAAVLVEEEQADPGYTSGRSTVHFKRVSPWLDNFRSLWEHNETLAAPHRLADYEMAVRQLVADGSWSTVKIRAALGQVKV